MNITNLIKLCKALVVLAGYLDTIRNLVGQAEAVFPAQGQGAAKLEWVKEQLTKSIATRDKLEKMWPDVQVYVTWFVANVVNKKP